MSPLRSRQRAMYRSTAAARDRRVVRQSRTVKVTSSAKPNSESDASLVRSEGARRTRRSSSLPKSHSSLSLAKRITREANHSIAKRSSLAKRITRSRSDHHSRSESLDRAAIVTRAACRRLAPRERIDMPPLHLARSESVVPSRSL
jgi:hypothetical protein